MTWGCMVCLTHVFVTHNTGTHRASNSEFIGRRKRWFLLYRSVVAGPEEPGEELDAHNGEDEEDKEHHEADVDEDGCALEEHVDDEPDAGQPLDRPQGPKGAHRPQRAKRADPNAPQLYLWRRLMVKPHGKGAKALLLHNEVAV